MTQSRIERNAYRREYYKKAKVYYKLKNERWRSCNYEKVLEINRQSRRKLRLDVLKVYSKTKEIACACCGYSDIRALSIDHIHGNGGEERKRLREKLGWGKTNGAGDRFYSFLRRNNYPSGYQVLCMNCNWIKSRREKCDCQI
jgi:hypothetical protein